MIVEGKFTRYEEDDFRAEMEKIYGTDIYIPRNIEFVPLCELYEPDDSFLKIPRLADESIIELRDSIKNYGLINPLLVREINPNNYEIISGYERYDALMYIYEYTGQEKYNNVPVIILKNDEVDQLIAELLRIDSNINRNYDRATLHKIIVRKTKILDAIKRCYKDFCTVELVARSLRLSKSTVYNYLSLDTLHADFMDAFNEHKITLKNAKKLSKFSLNFQEKIIEVFGGPENLGNHIISLIDSKAEESDGSIRGTLKYLKWRIENGPVYGRLIIKATVSIIHEFCDYVSNYKVSKKLNDNFLKFNKIITT